MSGTNSPYISDEEDTAVEPEVNLHLSRYGAGDDEEEGQAGGKSTSGDASHHRAAPMAPPSIKINAEKPYVEDDPLLKVIKICHATYDYEAQEGTEMSFEKGDRLAVYSFTPDRWGKGRNIRTLQRGEFPCNRTNVSEAPDVPSPGRRPLPPGPGHAVSANPVERIKIDPNAPVVGSPQVQRLSFFDNLNQDIAYREAKEKEKERTSGRAASPGRVQVVSPGRNAAIVSPGRHSQNNSPRNHANAQVIPQQQHRSAPGIPPGKRGVLPTHLAGSSPPAQASNLSQVRREVNQAPVGSPQVQRLSFFDNLNQDIAYRERKSGAAPTSGGPTITRIVADAEEYPEHERGTE